MTGADNAALREDLDPKVTHGLRIRRPNRLPVTVEVSPNLSLSELAGHADDIKTFAVHMQERLVREAQIDLSEPVAMYMGLVNDCAEMSALIRAASIAPKRSWSKLDEDDVAQMKADYAHNLSLGLTQLRLVLEYAKSNNVVDRDGKPQMWATHYLRSLLAKIRQTVLDWSRVVCWEAKYLDVPVDGGQASAERLLQEFHEQRSTPH